MARAAESWFEMDMTLGFNDRSGFRAGAALMFHPWSTDWMAPFKLKTLPLVFMDSHVYSYRALNACARRKAIDFIVDEVKKVRGQSKCTLASSHVCRGL